MAGIRTFMVFTGTLAICGAASANVDRILTLDQNGVIAGLPAQYSPAKLSFEPLAGITLQLGKSRTTVPQCLSRVLEKQERRNIQITGSWTGEESPTLPYYIDIKFYDPGFDASRVGNPGYSLIFSLETGKLLVMKRMEVLDEGRTIREQAVDLKSLCAQSQ
jgi:hypothetical protein